MKKCISIAGVAVIIVLLTAGLSLAQNNDMLNGKLVGVPHGSMADILVMNAIPDVAVEYFADTKTCLDALQAGKIDAAAYDEPVVRSLLRHYPDLMILPDYITNDNYAFAVNLKNTELIKTVDACIKELQTSGRLEKMKTAWLANAAVAKTTSQPERSGQKVLRFGTSSVVEPFTYKDAAGNIIGLDIEIAGYIAQKLDMRLEIVDMPFGQMIPALSAGEVDMIGACITISPERKKQVLFSVPYYKGGIAAAVKK